MMENQTINNNNETVQKFSNLSDDEQELINVAIESRKFAYDVYSNFKVGAAIRLLNGTIVGGCNIENSAFSPTICAERTAACKAISTGHTEFKAVAVIGPQGEAFTTPCGVCRQFLSEFVKNDIPIYVTKPNPNQVLITSLKSLLPMSFNLNDHPRA